MLMNGLYSLYIMRWINSFPFSPARRTDRSFLFYLYLIPCCFSTFSGQAQIPDQVPDQDSINYYLQIIKEGEKQVGRALTSIGYLYQKAGLLLRKSSSFISRNRPAANLSNNNDLFLDVRLVRRRRYDLSTLCMVEWWSNSKI